MFVAYTFFCTVLGFVVPYVLALLYSECSVAWVNIQTIFTSADTSDDRNWSSARKFLPYRYWGEVPGSEKVPPFLKDAYEIFFCILIAPGWAVWPYMKFGSIAGAVVGFIIDALHYL